MSYTPPPGDEANFSWVGTAAYTAPVGDAANFSFVEGELETGDSWASGTLGLGGPSGSGLGVYNNRNPQRVSTALDCGFQRAAPLVLHTHAPWALTGKIVAEPKGTWGAGERITTEPSLRWLGSIPLVGEWLARWERAVPREDARRFAHQVANPVLGEAHAPWGLGKGLSVRAVAPYTLSKPAHREITTPFQIGAHVQFRAHAPYTIGRAAALQLLAPWGIGRPPKPGMSVRPPVDPTIPPRVVSTNLVFCHPAYTGGPIHLVFGRACGPVDPYPPGTIVVPVRSVYMTVNSLALVRVSDGALIKADGFSISLSDDGWTWNWSASVQGRTMAMFSPESGEPVELEVTLNGVAFRLLAEEVGRDRAFKKNDLAVSGRGLAAELDELYAPTLNFAAAGDRTAQQLGNEALMRNGVGIGWDLDWGLEDWLVPGGVWSHQGTHISAVKAIAASVGGYVQPHRTAKTLRILHRYPVAPWDWADVTPEIVLPSAPVIVEGIKWASKPGYNRVHVSGQGAGGLGEVTRDGTAGDVSAPMVVDQLITAVEAARQRGRAELSDTGRQALVSLSLPVLSDTGFILPGQFLEYVDGGQTRIGLTRGAALSWDQPRMRQQITVETHEIA